MHYVLATAHVLYGTITDFASLCTTDGIRNPINTVSNIGAVAVLFRILSYVKRGTVTINGTTVTVSRDGHPTHTIVAKNDENDIAK